MAPKAKINRRYLVQRVIRLQVGVEVTATELEVAQNKADQIFGKMAYPVPQDVRLMESPFIEEGKTENLGVVTV